MKELAFLNKYLIKYKGRLIWGLVFVIISNAFQILPAQFVRKSIDSVIKNVHEYQLLDKSLVQQDFFSDFSRDILFYAILILLLSLLLGIFLYFVRQTLIVMCWFVVYDLITDILLYS